MADQLRDAVDAAAQSLSSNLFSWLRDQGEPVEVLTPWDATPVSIAADLSASSALVNYRAHVRSLTAEQRRGLLLEEVTHGHYRVIEAILSVADVAPEDGDALWTAASRFSFDQLLGLFDLKGVPVSDAVVSVLAAEAVEAGRLARLQSFVYYKSSGLLVIDSNRERFADYVRAHGWSEKAEETYNEMLRDELDARTATIFKAAAVAACRNGSLKALVILNFRDWFRVVSADLARAACGEPWSRSTPGPNLNVHVNILQFLLEHGVDAADVDWAGIGTENARKLLPFINYVSLSRLPNNIRKMAEETHARLTMPLQRARGRLDRPPTQELGTAQPTREQLTEHLRSAGRRFAQEYWQEGIPLFFPGQEERLGTVPREFERVPYVPANAPQGEDDGFGDIRGL